MPQCGAKEAEERPGGVCCCIELAGEGPPNQSVSILAQGLKPGGNTGLGASGSRAGDKDVRQPSQIPVPVQLPVNPAEDGGQGRTETRREMG
ncbi:hypothetical protein Q5P01_017973 [Channa striata]|uniref:Uncharacterized protein n=1 Tax=Channa striata TaxID=64152 RepID=A0AA88M4M3_CHASR|nr:hypothetical protein Q5P01_017973 [Channa striata]